MARSRKGDSSPESDLPSPALELTPEITASETPATPPDRLHHAESKLNRMVETNKICFRHQNDLSKAEQELAKFQYTSSELEYILEPKGQRMIPGFGYSDLEKQKQFVAILKRNASQRDTHTDRAEHSRNDDSSQER
jgi:hypothetical protein